MILHLATGSLVSDALYPVVAGPGEITCEQAKEAISPQYKHDVWGVICLPVNGITAPAPEAPGYHL